MTRPTEQTRSIVLIDFDGTLYPWGRLLDATKLPNAGAVQAVRRIRAAGYDVVIFTSRLSPSWMEKAGTDAKEQRGYIEGLLDRDGIPWDDITAEKVPADFYIDDKAIRYHDNWEEIAGLVVWGQ